MSNESFITDNIKRIRENMCRAAAVAGRDVSEICLTAATKVRTREEIQAAIAAKVDACGENRIQEMTAKLKEDAYIGSPLFFIGHLQRNKVQKAVGIADVIESVSSIELLNEINRIAVQKQIVQDILFEINIANEQSKSGMTSELAFEALQMMPQFLNVRLKGVMAIPPISKKAGENRHYFALMRQLYIDMASKKYDNVNMSILSMGMSDDYEDAILEGATEIRLGSAIFGPRTSQVQY